MITRLTIAGMTSPHCVRAVFTSLTPVAGIVTAEVTLGMAVIEHDRSTTIEALREAIGVSGYEVVAAETVRTLPLL